MVETANLDPLNPLSSSSSDSTTLHPSNASIIPLTIPISTKLNNNYLTWKFQILPLLHGYSQIASKGSLSCSDYLQHMRHLADELAFAGSPLSDEELVSTILIGLGYNYFRFVIAINTFLRHDRLSFSQLYGVLLTHESVLQQHDMNLATVNPSTFQTGWISFSNNKNHSNNNHPNPFNSSQSFDSNRPPVYRPNINLQNPKSIVQTSTYAKTLCQICAKLNHTAKTCYFHYEPDPTWKPRSTRQAFNA